MLVLEPGQIKRIEDKIALAEIKDNSLTVDLMDHVCCMIEERLESGNDFEHAESEVFKEMGILQMQAIEQETQLLTQNKITMKKRTKVIGIVAFVIMIIGLTFKLLHLPGAAIMWGIGILSMVFGFFLMIFVERFNYQKSNRYRLREFIGYLGSASLLMGIGFGLLKWPLAVWLAESGGILLLIYFIINTTSATHTTDMQ